MTHQACCCSFDSPRDMRQQQKDQAPSGTTPQDPTPNMSAIEDPLVVQSPARRPTSRRPPPTPNRIMQADEPADTDGSGTILAGDKQRLLIEIIDPGSR